MYWFHLMFSEVCMCKCLMGVKTWKIKWSFLARPHTLRDLPGPKRMLLHNWHNLFLKPRGGLMKKHLCIAAEKSSNLYCLSLIHVQQIWEEDFSLNLFPGVSHFECVRSMHDAVFHMCQNIDVARYAEDEGEASTLNLLFAKQL